MRVRSIASITLVTPSIELIRDFYVDHLALPFSVEHPGLLSLYGSDVTLNLLAAPEGGERLAGRTTGMTLRTRAAGDLAQLVDRLRARRLGVDSFEMGVTWGGARVVVRDPAGNRFALWEAPNHRGDLHLFDGPSHVAVRVKNLRQALDFYVGVLELPLIDQIDAQTASFFADTTNLIVTSGTGTPCPPITGETGICLSVEGMESYLSMLEGKRLSVTRRPPFGGQMLASVRDPDGNEFMLYGLVD